MADFFDFITQADILGTRLYTFCSLNSDTDMAVSDYQAQKGKIRHLVTQMSGELSFIEPEIIALGVDTARKYLTQEPRLAPYRRRIETTLHLVGHTLDAEGERIVALTAHFSGIPGQAASLLNNVDMPAWSLRLEELGKIRLNWQSYTRLRTSAHTADRRKVMTRFWRKHAQYRHTQAALLDGVVKAHFFNAKVHRFDTCLEAALKPQEISTEVYHTLIDSIRAKRDPLHRYLGEKARRLDLSPFTYEDMYASSIPQSQRFFSYEEASELIVEAMAPLGEEYGRRLKAGLSGAWTDRYPNKNKRSGAYSNGSVTDCHPYVLMNYDGQWNSVSTLAHEFGHAIHSDLSNSQQHPAISQYPIFLAEIASTLNETLLVEHMLRKHGDPMFKAYLIDQNLEELRGTLYRQTLFAEFELAIHHHVEEGNTLTADWLDELYLRLTRFYYGHAEKVTRVSPVIANEWSAIPHFFYNFYVYQYSTGIIAAIAFARDILAGNTAVRDAYLDMLRSGDARPPLETLSRAGVDLTRPEATRACLDHMNDLVSRLEEIRG
jgi:oligoendopeptidase F